jgi:arginase
VERREDGAGHHLTDACLDFDAAARGLHPYKVAFGDVVIGGISGRQLDPGVLDQLVAALRLIEEHQPARIVTLGGECSVSVAPFAALAERYGDDLALVWIDSHTPDTGYPGYHAMAVAALTGHGDPDVLAQLPATVPAERVALAGLHAWAADAYGHVADWGLTAFNPDQFRDTSGPLLDWLAATGCAKLAIHFDVDTIDSNEIVLGLGAESDGLTIDQARRVVADLRSRYDVVGLTVADFIPRQVIHLQQALSEFPLLA